MNKLYFKEKERREILIAFGFVLEVCLYLLTGFFLAYRNYFGTFLFFTMAIIVAFIVGDKIAKNAVLNFKWGV